MSDRGDAIILTPFFGQDSNALAQKFGGTPAHQDNDSNRYGLRASLKSPLEEWLTLNVGLDALGTTSTVLHDGSLTLPAREGDISVFGQPPGDEYAVDTWKTHILDLGPYAFVDVKLGPVTLTPGLRYDAYLIEGNKALPPLPNEPPLGFSHMETAFSPRASGRWDVTSRFALTAAYGQYNQAPQPEELSAVFGTPALALSKATHVTAGEQLRITELLSLDVVAFDKTLSDLDVRTRLQNPLVGRLLIQNGEGKSYGVQFLLRQEMWHGFFGWASYTISRSERRYVGDADFRLFDFDQPHVLSLEFGSQQIGRWSVGARFRYASGDPRHAGRRQHVRRERRSSYDPIFGPQNSIRIPGSSGSAIDARVDRTFVLGKWAFARSSSSICRT